MKIKYEYKTDIKKNSSVVLQGKKSRMSATIDFFFLKHRKILFYANAILRFAIQLIIR